MEFIKNYLRAIVPLSDESMNLILSCVVEEQFAKNSVLLTQGCPNSYMYVIKEGLVKGFVESDGKEICLSFWGENETFGDVVTYLTGDKATKSYIALENLIVYKFEIQQFRSFFDTNYQICNLGRILTEHYILRKKFEDQIYQIIDPFERYKYLSEFRKQIIHRLKGKDLASYLRVTPETLSRIRKRPL